MAASDLHQSPSFLISQLGAQLAALFAEALGQVGLTPRQYAVLKRASQPGDHRQQDLADSLGMHRNNMANLIDAMEVEGLVRRTPHPIDARCFLIVPTRHGTARLRRGDRAREALDRRVQLAAARSPTNSLIEQLQALASDFDLSPGVHPHLAASYPGQRSRARRDLGHPGT